MLCTYWSLIPTKWIFHRLNGKVKMESALFWGRFFRGILAKLSIIRKRNCIEGLKRGSSSEWMVMCFLTSDIKKSSETTMGTVKRTRVVVRAWFKFNLEIIFYFYLLPPLIVDRGWLRQWGNPLYWWRRSRGGFVSMSGLHKKQLDWYFGDVIKWASESKR